MLRALPILVVLVSTVGSAQLKELENPGTVSAVQERAYRMQHELNLGAGVLPLDAFYKGFYGQVAYTYHFNDYFAWRVGRGAFSYSARTGLREQLERDFNVLPTTFQEVQFFVGSDLMWKPFYGKFAVVNRWVLHGEAYLLLGGTLFSFTNTQFPFQPGVNVGGGVRLFISRYASFNLEFTDNVVLPVARGATGITQVMTLTLGLGINFGATE